MRVHTDNKDSVAPVVTSDSRNLPLKQIAFGILLLAIGTALGAMLASLPIRSRIPIGGSPSWKSLLTLPGIGSLTLYACVITSPLYFWLARRFPIDRQNWRKGLLIHLAVTTGFVLLTGIIFFVLVRYPMAQQAGERSNAVRMPAEFDFRSLSFFLLLRLLTESWQFWLMIALIHAYEFHRRYRERELETARLQTQLVQSRLEALTAQLHPHFLFNTLQAISTLMYRDVKAADAMLSGLSELLRQTLQRNTRHEVPLSEELYILNHYVSICCERFKNRLIINTHIAEDVHNAIVPFFILQPLVENALEHGIARRAGAGCVDINAERKGDNLCLSVTDNGPGIDTQTFPAEGIGLSNTRQRLKQLYGERQSLILESPATGGLRVVLTIPYKAATVSDDQKLEEVEV
jgi:sensor histidine kinase YesM